MSLSSAVIDALVATGCTTEQLAAAMKAANAEHDARLLRKRELDAARKRRQRELERMSRGVTRTDADSADKIAEKENPQTPKEKQEPPKENTPLRGVQKKRGLRIPSDFLPDLDWAVSEGLPLAAATIEAAKFRDYWASKPQNATKLDWPATWRNWVREAMQRGQTHGPPGKAIAPSLSEVFAHIGRKSANEQQQEPEDRSGFRSAIPHLSAVGTG